MIVRSVKSAAVMVALIIIAGCSGSASSTPAPVATGSSNLGNATYVGGALTPLRPPGTSSALLTMTVTSPAFTNGGTLPASAPAPSCSVAGTNTSPALAWTAGPVGTKSYLITMFDPDAPTGIGFVHWTIFDIPATVTSIPAGYGTPPAATQGGIDGYNDGGFSGYTGPCPPVGDGPHHYWITVTALNLALAPLLSASGYATTTTTSAATLAALTFFVRQNNAIVAQGQIIGTYGH